MDEGIKRKLAGAVVLVIIGIVALLQFTPSAKNVEHLSVNVSVEGSIPNMDMPLPKPLSISVPKIINANENKANVVPISSIKVDTETLPSGQFEKPIKGKTGQAIVWEIQVGSFSNFQNAISLRNKLRDAGYKAFERLTKDGMRTRIFVGPSTQEMDLKSQLKKINRAFKLKAVIKRKVVR